MDRKGVRMVPRRSRLSCALALFVLCFGLVATAMAQSAAPPPAARASIESGRLELNQIDAALQRETLDDRRLADLRQRLEAVGDAISELIQREAPRLDEIKARIEQLGAAPDASKGQTESEEVARDRTELQRLLKEADETLRLAKAQAVRVDQVGQAIADRRRANFAREILAQHASIFSPWLWFDMLKGLPADVRAFQFLTTQWAETIAGNLDWFEALLLVALAGLAAYFAPRAKGWVESGTFHRLDSEQHPDVEPTRMQKAMLALRMLLLNTVVPGLVLSLFYVMIDRFGLLPGRAQTVMEQLLVGLALIAFMNGLAGAVLAPSRPRWRLLALDDRKAIAFFRAVQAIAITVAVGRLVEAINGAIVASLPMSITTKGVFALIVAFFLASGLRHAFGGKVDPDAAEGSAASETLSLLPVRLGGWAAVTAISVAALLGFVPLASFLVAQLIWLSALALLAVLALILIDELIGTGLSAKGVLGSRLREVTGLKASSLDQVSVLGSGAARLLLFIVVGMVALAPWGVDSSNLVGNLRGAFFGFQVGGITISLSTIALAIGFFLIGLFITRSIQSWLDTRYLPQTTLDTGLRNSIRTIFGYVGIIMAAGVALSQLGVSLDKITIVAGALSVGIGFGLQSIVNNFVSGLILLWERPIRVGDWIVVGDEQGTVQRINVRATEILTFDRASLIIPNSEFISGRVKNWVHADRTARIIIPVNIEYEAEPRKVEDVLLAAALAHREVLSAPKPIVIFKNLGESGLDFELRCFVDVDAMLTTRSELMFDIFERLKQEGLSIPYPTRRLEITNMPAFAAQRPDDEPRTADASRKKKGGKA